MPFQPVTLDQFKPELTRLWARELPQDVRTEEDLADIFREIPRDAWQAFYVAPEGGALAIFDPESRDLPRRLECHLCMDPEQDNRLTPEFIHIAEDTAKRFGTKKISLWSTDLTPKRIGILEYEGFHLIQTVPVTRMSLRDFDPTPFEKHLDAVKNAGIHLSTVADLPQGQEWMRKLHKSTQEMVVDVPNPHQRTAMSFPDFLRMLEDRNSFNPELMFVALDGEEIVSYSRVFPARAMPGLVFTGLSGTVRSHRKRGIMTALKVFSIQRLKELGYTELQTDNDETNPMYALNVALGFRPVWHYLQYARR